MLTPAFTAALRSGREDFNARFALAKKQYPNLEAGAFGAFVSTTLNEVVKGVEAVNPLRVVETVFAGYEVALELVGQRLAGPHARHDWIDQTWQRVLTTAVTQVAEAPRQVMASMSNAIHQLATTEGGRPLQWIGLMERLGPRVRTVDELLQAGQVAAWRCGLAHYRTGALALTKVLSPPLALAALDAGETPAWPEWQRRLQGGPWPVLDEAMESGSPRLVLRTGSFRGFGGLFQSPPTVVAAQDQIYVKSGEDAWLLMADVFGATYHRAFIEESAAAVELGKLPPEVSVPSDIGAVTSMARTGSTLALTGSLTHAVLLFALSDSV